MSSSSAYSNVLLKSPVQSQAAPVQRRDYQEDHSSASFQQSFNDAHDSIRARDDGIRDEKLTKPAVPKKATQADNRNPVDNADKKSPITSQADKNNSRDPVSENDKSSDINENSEAQASVDKATNVKATESKTTAKKVCTDDKSTDGLAETILATNINAPAPITPTEINVAPLNVTPESKAETSGEKLESAEGVLSAALKTDSGTTLDGSAKNTLATADNNILTTSDKNPLVVSNKNTLTTSETSDQTPLAKSDSANNSPLTTTDLSLVDNSQLEATAALAQAQPAVNTDAAIEQSPAVLAGVSSLALPKSTLAQATSTPVTDESSETDSISVLATPLAGEKTSATAVTGDIKIATAPETTSAQTQVVDPKSTFEKTLQNLVHPESSAREESTSLPAAQTTSSTPSSTNVLDSMARFSDAQTPAARSFVVQTAVPVPVGQPQWSQAVGEKVLWLAAQNVSAAEIHLNPENLGPVQVKVSVNQEQTTINFTSHHAVVREVLDQNLGRLRDMFSEQGLNLVNVDVSDKSFSRQQGDAKDQKGQTNTNDINVEEEAPVAVSLIKQQRLVDHYA